MQTDTCFSGTLSLPQSHVLGYSIWLFSLIVTTPFQNNLHQSQGLDELFSGKNTNQNNLDWEKPVDFTWPNLFFQAELNLKSEHVAQGWSNQVLNIPSAGDSPPSVDTFSTAELCSQ